MFRRQLSRRRPANAELKDKKDWTDSDGFVLFEVPDCLAESSESAGAWPNKCFDIGTKTFFDSGISRFSSLSESASDSKDPAVQMIANTLTFKFQSIVCDMVGIVEDRPKDPPSKDLPRSD